MKILIVDDDPNTVQLIEESIYWKEYEIEDVFCAYQGVMALDIIEKEKPDIIISDIEMPLMDGLKMLEEITKKYASPPEFIFLTCHDSFKYAQKAIEYGVSDYLLKPFRSEALTAVLTKAVLRHKKKQEGQQLKEIYEYHEKNQDYLVQSFIRRLITQTIEGDTAFLETVTESRKINFDVKEEYYMVYAGINIDNAELNKMTEADYYFVFRNITTEIMYGRIDIPTVIDATMRPYYVLIAFIKKNQTNTQQIEQNCQRLIDVSAQYFGFNITCIVSEPVLPKDFGNMKKRLDKMFLQETAFHSKVILYEEDREFKHIESGIITEKITTLLKEQKKAELIVYVRDVLQSYVQEKKLDVYRMQAIHHDIMQVFYGFLNENHIQAYHLFQNPTAKSLNDAAEYTPMDMIKYVSYMYDCTIMQIAGLRASDTVISKAKKYIEQHFSENIGREEIASSVYLAPNYLSKIFKENTQMTIREYINLCRLEAAKRLMSTTNISITNIALQVGFDNIPYFSTVFKKYCNMTPAEWKNSMNDI